MSEVERIIDNMYHEIDNDTNNIIQKVRGINGSWSGEAKQSFDDAHREVQHVANTIKDRLRRMERLANSLESSVRAADRDIAAKRARELSRYRVSK